MIQRLALRTKRENKSIKEKDTGIGPMKLLSTADKHFKVWKSKANIYLIVDFPAVDFD